MPKQSKITKSTKPPVASPVKEMPEKFYCTRCTRSFKAQKSNFPASQSPIFKENNGYLPVCRHCIDEMYQHYKACLQDEKAAIRRICLKFDIYWNEKIYEMLNKTSTTNSRVLSYISRSNLQQFAGKTFDDTLDEESQVIVLPSESDELNESSTGDSIFISTEIVDFWGSGLAPKMYEELEKRYKYWCGEDDSKMDNGEKAVIRQICMLEVIIAQDAAQGKSIDRNVNALNTLLGSANLKPVQKRDAAIDATIEGTPFGVWIRKIEDTEPIPEPDPELKDVDGIIKNITVWFFGHLCKMLKIDNKYSQLYEEEMARLRVERPEYEGEDEETIFEDIFNRARMNEEIEESAGGGLE